MVQLLHNTTLLEKKVKCLSDPACDSHAFRQVYGECELSVHVDPKVKLQNYTCAVRQGRLTSQRDL